MPVRVMSNPAQLLLAGNPRRIRGNSKRNKANRLTDANLAKWSDKKILALAVREAKHRAMMARIDRLGAAAEAAEKAASNPRKGKPVSKKKKSRKSPAARAARAVKRKQKRATRKKGMPAGLRKYWAKKRAKSATKPRKARKTRNRRSKKVRMKVRRNKSRRRNRTVYASKGARVIVRRVRRGAARKPTKAQRRRARRVGVVGVNAGALTLTGGITEFFGNAKATMRDGVKGFAFAFGGAAGAVAGGAFMSRITNGLVAKVAPGMLSNPVVARLLGAVNYYLPGWALAKFVPGLSGKSRRAMLTGAAAAALVEVVRPGMIRNLMVQVPVIGGLMGAAEDQADGVGAYVAYALSGGNDNDEAFVGAGYGNGDDLGEYVAVDGDAAQNVGVGDYVALM